MNINKDKYVLITGAGSGIGKATTLLYSQNKYQCILVGRREDPLKVLQQELPHPSLVFPCDLSKKDQVQKILDKIKNFNVVGLVNNAGIIQRGLFENYDEQSLMKQFETNLFGAMRITKGLIPSLKRNSGFIINVSSSLGSHPIAATSIYSATKAAMINWTRTLAIEMAPFQVNVNCVSPGFVETPIHKGINMENMKDLQPLGRVGQPSEIAEGIYFLSHSPWTTGAVLDVDGGIKLI